MHLQKADFFAGNYRGGSILELPLLKISYAAENQFCSSVGVPTATDMGRTTREGSAHKIKAYGARLWSACTARQLEDMLAMKEDLFKYDRYRIPCKYLSYSRIDLDLTNL